MNPLNWNDSDIGAITLYPVGENDFVAFGSDNYSSQMNFMYLRRRNMSELSDTVVLTLASLWGGGSDIVNQFNQSQNKYRIQIVDYSQYNSEEPPYTADGAMNQLKMDLISGKAPDIIITQNHNDITALSGKGAFVDLYQFMENDPDVNRDTLMPNLLKACENSNGQLYSLSPSFSIKTMAVKTKFFDKENWTLDEMISLYDNAPSTADHLYDGMSKEEMFRNLFYAATDLVDYESGVCHFDSPDFVKILEFCNRFVDEVSMPDKWSEPEAHDQYYTDKFYWWSNDRIVVSEIGAGGDSSLSYTRDVDARDDITLVGYPSSNGSGGKLDFSENIAISATCPDKEGAWQFVRSYFTKEYSLPKTIGVVKRTFKVFQQEKTVLNVICTDHRISLIWTATALTITKAKAINIILLLRRKRINSQITFSAAILFTAIMIRMFSTSALKKPPPTSPEKQPQKMQQI